VILDEILSQSKITPPWERCSGRGFGVGETLPPATHLDGKPRLPAGPFSAILPLHLRHGVNIARLVASAGDFPEFAFYIA